MKKLFALSALLLSLVSTNAVVLYNTDTTSNSHGIPGTLTGTPAIWGAQSFVTDNSGRALGTLSVGYFMNESSVTMSPLVQILADNSNNPNLSSIVATLSYSGGTTAVGNGGGSLSLVNNGGGSITLPGFNTDFRLSFTAGATGLTLAPNTKYWIAVGGSQTGGSGVVGVGLRDFAATASGAWYADQALSNSDITSSSFREFNGSSLVAAPSFLMQVEMNSYSAVPEPGQYAAAFGVGLAGFAAWRRRRQAAQVA